ncbi:alpha/beta hydrolase [Streptomyces sp.]|uniref:alpha/beta hydrolase n=1 Tax=Streptomyces sp. TaxID=1931 RepID=UPI002F4152A2
MAAEQIPVVFIHGLWMHSSSWDPWVSRFNEHGYLASAPGWPGDGATAAETRADPDAVAGFGIDDVVAHYASEIAALPSAPVVIGHSFGGLITEKLLGMGLARGAVCLAPAQFKGILGLPLAQLRTAAPVLSRPGLRTKTWSHTADSYAAGFANAVPREESDALFEAYAIPSPARPLFQTGLANFTRNSQATVDTKRGRGPLLLIAGGKDRTVPAATVRAAYKIQRRNPGVTEFRIFEDRSHSMPADHGWREVADTALDFLARNGLHSTRFQPAG